MRLPFPHLSSRRRCRQYLRTRRSRRKSKSEKRKFSILPLLLRFQDLPSQWYRVPQDLPSLLERALLFRSSRVGCRQQIRNLLPRSWSNSEGCKYRILLPRPVVRFQVLPLSWPYHLLRPALQLLHHSSRRRLRCRQYSRARTKSSSEGWNNRNLLSRPLAGVQARVLSRSYRLSRPAYVHPVRLQLSHHASRRRLRCLQYSPTSRTGSEGWKYRIHILPLSRSYRLAGAAYLHPVRLQLSHHSSRRRLRCLQYLRTMGHCGCPTSLSRQLVCGSHHEYDLPTAPLLNLPHPPLGCNPQKQTS